MIRRISFYRPVSRTSKALMVGFALLGRAFGGGPPKAIAGLKAQGYLE
jgi:hypothetical protein